MSVDRLFRWTLLTFIFLLMIQYLANDFFTEFFVGNDGITAFATVILALAALVGLSTWRTQINGQYDTDLGRRIFEALSDYEEALYDLRHAEFVLYVAETKANGVGVPEAQKLLLSSEGAKLEFNNNVRKAEEAHNTSARHLTAVFKEADAMWKQSLNELAQPLLELRNSLSNLRRLIRTRDTYDGPEGELAELLYVEPVKKARADTIENYMSEDDQFAVTAKQTIDRITDVLRKKMGRS